MKRKLLKLFLFFSLCFSCIQPLFAEDTTPVPYNDEEFPETLKDLRRFEIISLGAMPFVTLDVTLVYSGIQWAKADFDTNNMPNIFAASSYTPEEQKKIILTSLGVSLGVGLADYGVRLAKRLYKEHKNKNQKKTIIINPISEDPDAILLDNPYDENQQEIENVDEVEVVE